MDELRDLCDEHNLILLEDCAQSHCLMYHGKPLGSIGRGAAFSFYPTKNLGAIGDGGSVATNDTALADKVRWLRQYGWRERYISDFEGINSRLDELQAAILRVKLPFLALDNKRRRSLATIHATRIPHHAPSGRHLLVVSGAAPGSGERCGLSLFAGPAV